MNKYKLWFLCCSNLRYFDLKSELNGQTSESYTTHSIKMSNISQHALSESLNSPESVLFMYVKEPTHFLYVYNTLKMLN